MTVSGKTRIFLFNGVSIIFLSKTQ